MGKMAVEKVRTRSLAMSEERSTGQFALVGLSFFLLGAGRVNFLDGARAREPLLENWVYAPNQRKSVTNHIEHVNIEQTIHVRHSITQQMKVGYSPVRRVPVRI